MIDQYFNNIVTDKSGGNVKSFCSYSVAETMIMASRIPEGEGLHAEITSPSGVQGWGGVLGIIMSPLARGSRRL